MPDPYLQDNGTLRNKLGVSDPVQLAYREGQIASIRGAQFLTKGVDPDWSVDGLRTIHRHLFGDVYDWAGEFRSVNLLKQVEAGSAAVSAFTPYRDITEHARRIDGTLRARDCLRGLCRDDFCIHAADLMLDINRMHPFREGNGRTQQMFIGMLAKMVGHPLDFTAISRERMVLASVLGHRGDPTAMRRMFSEITDPVRVRALTKAVAHLDRHEVDWNEFYIATAVEGQTYAGEMIGRSGKDFMLLTDRSEPRLIIGDVRDLGDSRASDDEVEFTATRFGGP